MYVKGKKSTLSTLYPTVSGIMILLKGTITSTSIEAVWNDKKNRKRRKIMKVSLWIYMYIHMFSVAWPTDQHKPSS